ncbi:MAG: hypothetical protein FWG79_09280, partial [Bacteroidales bacterium]|nr:hypothetical protein [Bacteroidales bacterium]
LLNDQTFDSTARWNHAYTIISQHCSPEEAEQLAMTVVFPFVQRTWAEQSRQLGYLSWLNQLISFKHRDRGGDDKDEKERYFAEKALEIALESGLDVVIASCYHGCAFIELRHGDVKRAHENLYQAIIHYDKRGLYTNCSEMLYVIVSNFFEIKDTDGMGKVLQQMKEYLEKDESKQSLYQYNVIKHSYFGLLLENAKKNEGLQSVDYRLVDSVLVYVRENIYLVENYFEQLSSNWIQAYAYYFLAKTFDDYFPEQTDTIFLYLDKAFDLFEKVGRSRVQEPRALKEFQIYVLTVRANALSRKGNTQEAYRTMREALVLHNDLKDYQNLGEQRSKAYQFMADYYEKANRPADALRYQKLLRESEAERYESEKIRAINEMSVKFETEKKETRIQTLLRENQTARRILWLTLALSLTLLMTALLVILSSRLKRKNVEQRLYETALLAELRQSELEQIHSTKQQLEQYPVKNTIDTIAQQISAALIDRDTKAAYLDRLSKIDCQLLEHAYQTSKVKLTGMDIKYIICFSANIDVKDISLLFNIEPASVHTVRYRIRRKFAKGDGVLMMI